MKVGHSTGYDSIEAAVLDAWVIVGGEVGCSVTTIVVAGAVVVDVIVWMARRSGFVLAC